MSGMGLLTEAEAQRWAWERVASGAWWVIPWLSVDASRLCEAVEARYYRGAAAADFELCVGSPVVSPIAFARKRRMGARRFARLLVEYGTPGYSVADLAACLARQDVLIIPPAAPGEPAAFEAAVRAWHAWVLAGRDMPA